jgi:hypothetical protein
MTVKVLVCNGRDPFDLVSSLDTEAVEQQSLGHFMNGDVALSHRSPNTVNILDDGGNVGIFLVWLGLKLVTQP